MTGKTHVLGGIAMSAGALLFLEKIGIPIDFFRVGICLVSSVFGALVPDIDEPNSTISHKMPMISSALAFENHKKKLRTFNPFVSREEKIKRIREARAFRHRGQTHYLTTWLMLLTVCCGLSAFAFADPKWGWVAYLLMGIPVGVLSHIILDLLSGKLRLIPDKKSVGIRIFKTGGILEKTVIRPVLLLTDVFLIYELASPFI